MQINTEWKDFEVIATGNGEKLERWGDVSYFDLILKLFGLQNMIYQKKKN